MRRRPNFTDEEKNALINAVLERYELICGHFTDLLTPNSREDAWKEVLVAVNYVSEVTRVLAEVKKKYQSLKRRISSQAASGGLFVEGDPESINFQIKEEIKDDEDDDDDGQLRITESIVSENDSNQSRVFDTSSALLPVKSSSDINTGRVFNNPIPKLKINYNPPKRAARKIAPKKVSNKTPRETFNFNSAPNFSFASAAAECLNSATNFSFHPVAGDNQNESLTVQLKRIADLMEERNQIERERLELKRKKLKLS